MTVSVSTVPLGLIVSMVPLGLSAVPFGLVMVMGTVPDRASFIAVSPWRSFDLRFVRTDLVGSNQQVPDLKVSARYVRQTRIFDLAADTARPE